VLELTNWKWGSKRHISGELESGRQKWGGGGFEEIDGRLREGDWLSKKIWWPYHLIHWPKFFMNFCPFLSLIYGGCHFLLRLFAYFFNFRFIIFQFLLISHALRTQIIAVTPPFQIGGEGPEIDLRGRFLIISPLTTHF
jgi:hypothetical protein